MADFDQSPTSSSIESAGANKKSWRRFEFAILAVLAVAAAIGAYFEPIGIFRGIVLREAFYNFRPTEYWRCVLLEDGKMGRLSDETIGEFRGSRFAVPVLEECFNDRDPRVRQTAIMLLSRCAYGADLERILTKALDDSDQDVQYLAIREMAATGTDALGPPSDKLAELRLNSNAEIAAAADALLWQVAPEVAGHTKPWERFVSEEWKVEASLPGTPKEEQSSVKSQYGPILFHNFSVEYGVDTASFTVSVVEYPPKARKALQPDQFFELTEKNFADGLRAKMGSVQSKVSRTRVCGRDGIATEFEGDNGLKGDQRVVIVGSRVYEFQVIQQIAKPLRKETIDFFFASCEINYEPEEKSSAKPEQAHMP